MTKPWEETWVRGHGVVRVAANGDGGPMRFGNGDPWRLSDESAAVLQLASAAPDLYRALLAVEWRSGDAGPRCPGCDRTKAYGHASDCALAAALRKARGEA